MVALGLCGESGEFADHIKKGLHHGHKIDRDYLTKELGDVLWYVAVAADKLGIALEAVANQNIEKLEKRCPDGFDEEKSRNRVEL